MVWCCKGVKSLTKVDRRDARRAVRLKGQRQSKCRVRVEKRYWPLKWKWKGERRQQTRGVKRCEVKEVQAGKIRWGGILVEAVVENKKKNRE